MVDSAGDERPRSRSSDGRYLVYIHKGSSVTPNYSIWVLPIFRERKPFSFLASAFNEFQPELFPNGKSLAYTSHESGTDDIFVVPFPGKGRRWQLSGGGGSEPRWRRDGKELFHLAPGGKMMVVEIREKGSSLDIAVPQQLY